MKEEEIRETIERVATSAERGADPRIELVKSARWAGRSKQAAMIRPRVGVFSSSFNPPTVAHVEIVRLAARLFSLDETLAAAGVANADKSEYECPLEDRLQMLLLAFADNDRVSIGLSSHAYFVDMLEALEGVYSQQTDLHFIVGFDTFERVLDRQSRYTRRYHCSFRDQTEAFKYLLARSSIIVASRAGAGGNEIRALIEDEAPHLTDRVMFFETPADIGDQSATEVRGRVRAGQSIEGLVPRQVEKYIEKRGLYR